MNRRQLILAGLLAAVIGSNATDYRKLSAYVRGVASQQQEQQALARATDVKKRTNTLTAFVRVDMTRAEEVWRVYGCKPYAVVGDIAIAAIPLSSLGPLSDHPAVHRIEASPTGRINMDTTAIVVAADKLYNNSANIHHLPLTGQGVVIGVMDIGFDLTHPNFLDSTAKHCRIGAFWDQLAKDTIGSLMPVGREYTASDIPTVIQHSTDGLIQTHGTHTLGIAAGSGYHSRYKGIAPDADICLVSNAVSDDIALIDSADIEKYTSATDALGFKYIFDYADSKGKPCVASFSEGYAPYLDKEDSLYAAFLDSITGNGHIIVASAGNECVTSTYMVKNEGQDAAGTFLNTGRNSAFYRVKSQGKDMQLTIFGYRSGTVPTDTLLIKSQRFQTDSILTDTLFIGGDTCAVTTDRYPSTLTTDTVYNINFTANKALSALPPIAIVLEGRNNHTELYGSSGNGLGSRPDIDQRWNAAESTHNIHAPACFPSVICVGATAHRFGFTNYKGEYRDFSGGRTVGHRSPYSSVGPAMNGEPKPDVMAPGDNIISSYSSFYLENKPDASDINSDVEHFEYQGHTYAWNANSGTSMATPVVAGIIALWLQAKPDLTREEIVDAFRHTCRHPDNTLSYPNNDYGFGEIDAYGGLLYLLRIDGIADVSHHQPQRTVYRQQGKRLYIGHDGQGTISIYDLRGHLHRRIEIKPETYIDLSTLPDGIYVVQTTTDNSATTGSALIRL